MKGGGEGESLQHTELLKQKPIKICIPIDEGEFAAHDDLG